jgi:hypothetical protein
MTIVTRGLLGAFLVTDGLGEGSTPTPTPTPTGSFVGTRLVAVLLSDNDPFGVDAARTQLTSNTAYTAVLLSADDPFGIDPEQTQLTTNSIEPPPVIGDFLLIGAGGGSLLIGSGSDKVLIDG